MLFLNLLFFSFFLARQVFSVFKLRESAQNADPPPSPTASLATFLESSSPLFADLPLSEHATARALAYTLDGWTGASYGDVSLRWWGFEQDFDGEDREVHGVGYSGWLKRLADRFVEQGGKIKLGEIVREVADDDKGAFSGLR